MIDDALNKIFEMPAVRGNHKKSEKKVSSRTVFDCRKVLSRAFGWAAKTPSITAVKSNPVADVAWSVPKSKKRKVLTEKEMLAVLDIARENNYLMYVFLIVLAQLSSRTGEAVALQWSDLDHDNKGNPIMHVNKSLAFRSANWMDQTRDEGIIMRLGNPPSTTNIPTREWVLKRTKTGAEEGTLMDYGYLTPEIEALLVRYKAWQGEMIRQNSTYKDMNFIFAQTTGFPITSEVYTKQFRQLLTEANIANPEQYDVYSLRHFSVSKKLDLNGNDFASVRSDTKHKETQTLVAYYDIPEDKKRIQTAAGMSDFLFNRPATENDSDESAPYKEDSRIAQLIERFKQNPDQLESLLTLFGISNGNDKSD